MTPDITRHRSDIYPDLADALHDQYTRAFTDVDTLAAQRHLMNGTEFRDVMYDPRIIKHVARTPTGNVIGHSVITNNLDAWPLISPRYFERHWPDLYREERIFYVGYVCTDEDAPHHLFRDLIADMAEPVFKVNGMAVMDFCTHNIVRRVPQVAARILSRLNPVTTTALLDRQEFYAWRFDGHPVTGTPDE